MLSRVSRSASRAALRRSTRTVPSTTTVRNYVQPSGADRASVVDVPANYQDDAHFAPRPGAFGPVWIVFE